VAEPTYLAAGTVLQDRYEIAGELGRGGYSVVYRARDRRIGSDVAIKLLVPPPAAARLARERLRREVQAVRQLSHPNIVTVYDVADDGPWSFVVMEHVPGPDLAVRVRDRGPLDPDAAARLGRDVAAALDAAHRRGILHRDVKPQNILLDPDGRARLTDFGSARLAGMATVTQTGGLVGTLAYAAPEVVAGARGDARADCYGLGLTLYFALLGVLPERATLRTGPAPEPNGYHPRGPRADVPGWLDAAVARATASDPDDRFPSVTLLAASLIPEDRDTLLPPPPKGTCVFCRATEPFGLGVCPRCARRASSDDDVLVFVERTTPGPARQAVLERLRERIPAARAAGHEAAAGGERPLLRVPASAGGRVMELLDAHGIPARTEALTNRWRAPVPASIAALAGVVATAGTAAGVAAATPVLLISAPVMAAGLASVAALGRRTPVWNPPPAARSALPADVERDAVRTLAALPTGAARRLLIDLLRRASAMPGAADLVGPLVIAACAAARELAALEQHLDVFDTEREHLADPPAGWLDALARCERGRDAMVQRLLDATATLSRVSGDSALRAASSAASLADLTRELDAESRVQAEAASEITELLNGA